MWFMKIFSNDIRPIFEAYNERDGLEEALEGFRERIRDSA